MTCSTRILIARIFSVHMFLPLEEKKKKKRKGGRGAGKKGKGGRKRETKEKKEKRLQKEQDRLQKEKNREAEKAKKDMFNKGKKAECSHVLGSWGRGSCCYMVWHLHTGWHPADQKRILDVTDLVTRHHVCNEVQEEHETPIVSDCIWLIPIIVLPTD